jgi:DNA recombination protein RmuC
MDVLSLVVGLFGGVIAGFVLARVLWKTTASTQADPALASAFEEKQKAVLDLSTQLATVHAELKHQAQDLESARKEKVIAQTELASAQAKVVELTAKISSYEAAHAGLEERSKAQEDRLKSQKEYLEEVRKQSKTEFENLANQILEAKTKNFSEHTEKNLENILKPLKEKIATFEKRVEDSYNSEAKERFALKSEVERLITLNEKMTLETNSLTQALKGDSKFQGDWGEMVLANILEASGLREGHEYILQQSFLNDDGDRKRPDVTINLPDNKHVIIDSKVSLTNYEVYCRTEDPVIRAEALKAHLISISKHIDELADQNYSKLKGVNSPDFVFMFIPIEPAYVLAVQNDRELFSRAWKKGVAVVTSTILMTNLKTIGSIWKIENRNKNSEQIAVEAARLYDKFFGFLEDFEKIGRTFELGQSQYVSAMGKLKDGTGSVFRKMEVLRELGASPNKQIKQDLLD